MRIIFDIDGTMTDFRDYLEKHAFPWFYKKYGLVPLKKDELELEDILDLQNCIQKEKNCAASEAKKEAEMILNRYWISHRFLRFSLFGRFRPGCASVVRRLKQLGGQIEIFTSRAHSQDSSLVGCVVRVCTACQLWLNGVFVRPSRIRFFQDDEDKLAGIIQANPHLVFDDKPEILNKLHQEGIPLVCIAGPHNTELQQASGMEQITGYQELGTDELLRRVFGKELPCLLRAAGSDKVWGRLVHFAPMVRQYFRPLELHSDRRILTEEAVLYAPNHRSTLDPLVILSVVRENIHWAALLRFFQAKDSIFNNSKNPLLCRVTAWLFRSLEYFPVERHRDNPDANNLRTIRDMHAFLRISQKVGVFAEGTTKRAEGSDFGIFDKSIFILAKAADAWIQPVTIYWFRAKKKRRAILNWGSAFKVGDTETARETFLQIQQESLRENIVYVKEHFNSK